MVYSNCRDYVENGLKILKDRADTDDMLHCDLDAYASYENKMDEIRKEDKRALASAGTLAGTSSVVKLSLQLDGILCLFYSNSTI